MILVDTSVWIDHLREGQTAVQQLMEINEVLLHPFVLAEIALGSLPDRAKVLANLARLPAGRVVTDIELLELIEARRLYSTGLALADTHLLATALLDDRTLIWTRDKRLERLAATFGVSATLP
jgi:predicted nucleic acid-binding protein